MQVMILFALSLWLVVSANAVVTRMLLTIAIESNLLCSLNTFGTRTLTLFCELCGSNLKFLNATFKWSWVFLQIKLALLLFSLKMNKILA
jgi:hypothetical protein